MNCVLIVEDETPVRRLMVRWLETNTLRMLEAASAEQGLLPRGQSGLWLADELRRRRPETAVVIMTGVEAFDAAVTGLRAALAITEPELSDLRPAAMLREIVRADDVHAVAPNVPYLAAASAIAVAVEERFDGTGTPLRLRGNAILRGARVLAAAAAHDALVSEGTTAPVARARARALEHLSRERAGWFDPAVLTALQSVEATAQEALSA